MSRFSEEFDDRQFAPISVYCESDDSDINLEKELMNRHDLILNLDNSLDFDLVVEDLVHSVTAPDELSIEKIIEICDSNKDRIQKSIENYIDYTKYCLTKSCEDWLEYPKGTFNAYYNAISLESLIISEAKFKQQVENITDVNIKYQMVLEHTLELLYDIRYWQFNPEFNQKLMNGDHVNRTELRKVYREIKKALLNIRNFRYAMMGGTNVDLLTKLLSVDTYTTPEITVVNNNKQNAEMIIERISIDKTTMRTLPEVICMLQDKDIDKAYYERLEYANRIEAEGDAQKAFNLRKAAKSSTLKAIYSSNCGLRPHDTFGDYEYWNGFQAFDLDIKNDETITDVNHVKRELHRYLQKYAWYIGVKKSISGTGLHVMTKVKAMHNLYVADKSNRKLQRYWMSVSYYQKYCAIKYILTEKLGFDKSSILKVLDKSMLRVAQGIALSYDSELLLNDNFADLPIIYNFTQAPVQNVSLTDWLTEPENLKYMFKVKAKMTNDSEHVKYIGSEHVIDQPTFESINLKFLSSSSSNTMSVTPIDEDNYEKGRRDMMRQQVIRTCVYIFGDNADTRTLLRHLLKVGVVLSDGEFMNKYRYACRKPFAYTHIVALLKRQGCKIDIEIEDIEGMRESLVHKAAEELRDSVVDIDDVSPNHIFDLGKVKYLGDIETELLDAIRSDKINIIESAPGTGKTQLFNELAKTYTILLVEPFVSVLQNKIEKHPVYGQTFDVCYGGTQVKVKNGRSIATTFDKFSRLTIQDYKNFDIIAIDESHLLFTSTYRERVTSRAIKNIRKFVSEELAIKEQIKFVIGGFDDEFYEDAPVQERSTKLVLMTGTITGELLYFTNRNMLNYVYIKNVHKHGKHCEFLLTETNTDKNSAIIRTIAQALDSGATVICPTNAGDLYAKQIVYQVNMMIEKELELDHWLYYKKSNSGMSECSMINEQSKLEDKIRLLFCTVYLGVGVDIVNDKEFHIVYDGDRFTPEDIEQFNNRIRRAPIRSTVVYSALQTDKQTGIQNIKKSIYVVNRTLQLKNAEMMREQIIDDARIASINHTIDAKDREIRWHLPEFLNLNSQFHTVQNGTVVFESDKFIIHNFAYDYFAIATAAAYTKHVLGSKYDYSMEFNAFAKQSQSLLDELSDAKKEAKQDYIYERTDAYIKTVDFIIEHYNELSNPRTIEYVEIAQHEFEISMQSAELYGIDQKPKLIYTQKFNDVVQSAYKTVRRLCRYYDVSTVQGLLSEYINSETKNINGKKLEDDLKFASLVYAAQTTKLPVATADALYIVEEHIDHDAFDIEIDETTGKISMSDIDLVMIKNKLLRFTDHFIKQMCSMVENKQTDINELVSDERKEEVFAKTMNFMKLFLPGMNRGGRYVCQRRQIPKFDNAMIAKSIEYDTVIERYMKIVNYNINDKNMIVGDATTRTAESLLALTTASVMNM